MAQVSADKNNKIKMTSSLSKIDNLRRTISLLTPIDKSIIIRFNRDRILFYSMIIHNFTVQGGGTIVAMKYFIDDTNKYFDIEDDEMEKIFNDLDFVLPIVDAKNLDNKLNFIKGNEIKIAVDSMPVNDITGKYNYINGIVLTDSRFKTKVITKDRRLIRLVDTVSIKQITEPSNIDWSFKMTPSEITEVKTAMKQLGTKADGVEFEPLNLTYKNNKILAEQREWALQVGELITDMEKMKEVENIKITINKGFFNAVPNVKEDTTFNVYPVFMVCGDTSKEALILAYEQDY